MFEIKRNIFESSVRMPQRYEPVAVPLTPTDANSSRPSFYPALALDVKHAPSPRIGEQK